MLRSTTVQIFSAVGLIAFAALAGSAYAQKSSNPAQVEIVNRTVLVGAATLHVASVDPRLAKITFDVSPYSTVRLVIQNAGCSTSSPNAASAYVENIANLESIAVGQSVQRVYDIPGESLTIMIANSDQYSCDYAVTLWGRRN